MADSEHMSPSDMRRRTMVTSGFSFATIPPFLLLLVLIPEFVVPT